MNHIMQCFFFVILVVDLLRMHMDEFKNEYFFTI